MGWLLTDSWTVAKRHLLHIRSMPEKLADVTIQPVVFVFMFAYIFGSAIAVPGGNYREFLLPGVFVQSMAMAAVTIMAGIVSDMASGVMDRFRALPMARAAVLIGHTGANLVESVLGIVAMTTCGLIVGWRPELGPGPTLAAFGLLLLFGFAMSWVGVFAGLFLKSSEGAQGLAFVVIMPLTFVANTFVPTGGMPAILRAIANWNPTSAVVTACRHLFGAAVAPAAAWPQVHPLLASLLWCIALVALFLPLSVWRFRRAMVAR